MPLFRCYRYDLFDSYVRVRAHVYIDRTRGNSSPRFATHIESTAMTLVSEEQSRYKEHLLLPILWRVNKLTRGLSWRCQFPNLYCATNSSCPGDFALFHPVPSPAAPDLSILKKINPAAPGTTTSLTRAGPRSSCHGVKRPVLPCAGPCPLARGKNRGWSAPDRRFPESILLIL